MVAPNKEKTVDVVFFLRRGDLKKNDKNESEREREER
jgi:hypothetical protein